ncbi:hypothetical protein [Burkholderia cenocepacia]|uniref:hypothetical protein n=1 Tax=Burkholderia cenocepacia TaxID=95486 RepID=UPI00158D11F1|nr:hypothetical protein [Burkholderia cenocepacia]
MKELIKDFKGMGQGIAELWKANPAIPNDPMDIVREAKKIHLVMSDIREKYGISAQSQSNTAKKKKI